ncbi:hypothetical protein GCM10011338_21980 [Alteromonas lipolytica]|uniref:Uncharacterized protein n=2 Tax=Alteromonas lipolytica TaxID=1856405 RepID=A0A1E8FD38_9ALTE|nr:hypothetical protein BFC17_19035 [Alteromonas lipolytica]GGF69424.1 hypothetical protein GCM10011338_21980 [Alteromonas lipolytica]
MAESAPLVTIAGQSFSKADIKFTPKQLKTWREAPSGQAQRGMFTFSKVAEFIHHAFILDFAKNNALTASPEFVASFKKAFASDTLKGDKLETLAQFSALEFAVDAFLYQREGGKVIFDQSHPMLPIEAYFNAYKAYANSQRLVFTDAETERLWWLSFARVNAIEVPAEQVEFSVPWWHKLD